MSKKCDQSNKFSALSSVRCKRTSNSRDGCLDISVNLNTAQDDIVTVDISKNFYEIMSTICWTI